MQQPLSDRSQNEKVRSSHARTQSKKHRNDKRTLAELHELQQEAIDVQEEILVV